ncbi:MAG: MASE1 domain-containing protein, partial [Bacteroidota bacterium]
MIDHRLSGGRIQRLAAITLLALLYYTTARLGLTMEAVSGFATLVWPPTGISLAALLILGYRVWPWILIGALFANLAVGASIPLAVSIGVGNTCEALLGAYLLTRVPGFRNSLERLRDVVGLIFFAAVLSTMVSATVGVANLWVGGVVPPSDVGRTWVAWWVGDAIGDLIVAPVFLVWSALPRIRFRIWRVVEAALLGAVVLITTLTVFGWLFRPDLHNYIPPYFIFPVLIWVSLRFGQRGGVTATLAVSVIAVWCTALGFGPFQSELLSDRLLKLQTFMGVVSMSTLLLAAVITERRKAEEASRESKERYRNLVENIREVYYISDRDGKLVYGSPNLFRESGYQERELIGQSYVR